MTTAERDLRIAAHGVLPHGARLRRLRAHGPCGLGRWAFALAVPARNEAARLPACLEAAGESLWRSGLPAARTGIVLLANNSRDATAGIAAAWAAKRHVPLLLAEVDLPDRLATAGVARRLALDLAHLASAPHGVLATSDADSRAAPAWVGALLAGIYAGHDMVCGSIRRDPQEPETASAALRARWSLERSYFDRQLELDAALDPDGDGVQAHAGRAFGASLAVRASAYRAVGGLPTPAIGEDRALLSRMRAADRPVCTREDACVFTSWRRDGRSGDGLAQALSARAADADYLCDEALEPAGDAARRARARAALRDAWRRGEGAAELLAALNLPAEEAERVQSSTVFGSAWQRVERLSPALRPTRMKAGRLQHELPLIERRLALVRRDERLEAA